LHSFCRIGNGPNVLKKDECTYSGTHPNGKAQIGILKMRSGKNPLKTFFVI
jgi:hypothetical protein